MNGSDFLYGEVHREAEVVPLVEEVGMVKVDEHGTVATVHPRLQVAIHDRNIWWWCIFMQSSFSCVLILRFDYMEISNFLER